MLDFVTTVFRVHRLIFKRMSDHKNIDKCSFYRLNIVPKQNVTLIFCIIRFYTVCCNAHVVLNFKNKRINLWIYGYSNNGTTSYYNDIVYWHNNTISANKTITY